MFTFLFLEMILSTVPKYFLILHNVIQIIFGQVLMTRDGCGETKGCLFKPAGCDPMRDCTQSIIFYVSGPNLMMIQLSATSLVPPPPLQYMAVAFSKDLAMVIFSLFSLKLCQFFIRFFGYHGTFY
jgi:hypothetical protein